MLPIIGAELTSVGLFIAITVKYFILMPWAVKSVMMLYYPFRILPGILEKYTGQNLICLALTIAYAFLKTNLVGPLENIEWWFVVLSCIGHGGTILSQ